MFAPGHLNVGTDASTLTGLSNSVRQDAQKAAASLYTGAHLPLFQGNLAQDGAAKQASASCG